MSTHGNEPSDLERVILEFVRRPDYRPMKPRQIARRLDLDQDQAAEVRRTVKRLSKQGLLIYAAKHFVQPVAPVTSASAKRPHGESPRPKRSKSAGAASGGEASRVSGVFHRAQGGFGFVRPLVVEEPGETVDIYIPARDTGDAADGDTVLVRLQRSTGRPRQGPKRMGPQGAIVEILKRETHQFVGTYQEQAGAGYVQVDGGLFAQPIVVGDPGAKGVAVDDKVVIEMIRFPSHVRDGEGVIVEVLGPRGKPGVDTLSILREFALPEQFPDDVLDESRQSAERFQEHEGEVPGDRMDLTGETIITIDPPDARDFDDAISLVKLPDGHWRLGVHIADVSHFVRPRTPLDREARNRATSVYLPDRVIPMLPELISNGLASLQPDKLRYTKTAFLEYSPEGLCVDAAFHNSVIRSSKRLTYDQVDEFLANPEPCRRKWGVKVCDLLTHMHALAMILRARRFKRGALELSMREVHVELDRHGAVSGAKVVENTVSHQIIEEFMLAANEAVAEWLQAAGVPFLRRIHKPPSERKLKALKDFVGELGLKTDDLQSRFALQGLLADVIGRPEQHAVNYALLRSLQRAIYSPAAEGHYALASTCYCHFTSPIRRYPDLTIHRLFDARVSGRRAPPGEDLFVLGQHCSDQEQRAEMAERELTKLKLLWYLSQRIGYEMDAIVTGVESYGLFAQGIELPAEGLVPVASLGDDTYHFDRGTHSLIGRREGNAYRLGDPLRVAVAAVDLDRRKMELRPIGRPGRVAPARAPAARRPRPGKPKHEAKRGKSRRRGK